ncbi:MAG: FAD-dependent thymidylate synthase [Myxococcota bacterium]
MSDQTTTRRPCVPALEAILGDTIPVLDHGFVRVVDYMGDDGAIVQAARVSYGRGTKKVNEDRGLIRYLMRHRHTTPLEMCEIKLHVKLPIFVARQWIRHRTASVNEYSARYSILDHEFYLPTEETLGAQATGNRQGRGDPVSKARAAEVLGWLRGDAEQSYAHYKAMLNLDGPDGGTADPQVEGIARELARINLSLGFYTQWYWKIDLHNLLHFLSLRIDPHAQHEIRVYGEAIARIVEKWVPWAWEAFRDYRLEGASLSRMELAALRAAARGEAVGQPDLEALGMSKREAREFFERFPEIAPEK